MFFVKIESETGFASGNDEKKPTRVRPEKCRVGTSRHLVDDLFHAVFGFEGTNLRIYCMAQWLSWLERRPVTAKVVGSSPIWVVTIY